MNSGEQPERFELEVSTTESMRVAPAAGGRGVPTWWVVLGIAFLAAAVIAAFRVGETSAPAPPTTTTPTTDVVTTTDAASPSVPSTTIAGEIEVGDVVQTDVVLPVLGLDVAVLDDAYRLWVLHPADGTAAYRGQVQMHRISVVGGEAPPWVSPSLSVSNGGWLLVGGTFGTMTVNPEGQHILTAHDGLRPTLWHGPDSVTYTYLPDIASVHFEHDPSVPLEYGGSAGWIPAMRVGPMEGRVVVETEAGSVLVDDGDVSLLTPDEVLDVNQRFFIERDGDGELTVAELESGNPVGTVSPSFLTDSETAEMMSDPELEASLAPDGRTVSLLDSWHVFVVDVASGEGGFTALARQRDPYGTIAASWDAAGRVATWVVGGEIRIVGLDRSSATIGPTIRTDGPVSIGTPIAAVAYQPQADG